MGTLINQQEPQMRVKGKTILLDIKVWADSINKLSDVDFWRTTIKKIIGELGLTFVSDIGYKFDNCNDKHVEGGVSVTCILLESHCSVHTWPEYGYLRFELSSCRENINSKDIEELLYKKIHIKNICSEDALWNR